MGVADIDRVLSAQAGEPAHQHLRFRKPPLDNDPLACGNQVEQRVDDQCRIETDRGTLGVMAFGLIDPATLTSRKRTAS